MTACKNFNTIHSTDINEIKKQLLNFERYVFTHSSYNCVITILPGQEHCNLSLVDTFSYEFIDYFNITLEDECICIQQHNLSPTTIHFRYS
ncbi:hypothetical protein [Clostridium chauvoei]|uniref:hypothetical protein n=1 Tax=Clostridium chauvoei TaxID=46867 RepID=UPI00103D945A|nr:hypothetical protein [Clostridium chauvoei]MBX7281587.1 hypothetical protein [Clostridium chauvoei]MBX7284107.1 hypothetical protein [Clostridium chauvoei]MBX7286645.1 hypothetical protein [Clostridium chauvoei]MBX7289155.1 hypothetical protein [Clostridium chauvoei]MBX7294221.1 hypothetical protein [Clostridium chauvoei]